MRRDTKAIRDLIDQDIAPAWNRLYGEKMKSVFDEELGAEGRVMDDAYKGRYAGGMYGDSESVVGETPGRDCLNSLKRTAPLEQA